MSGMGWARVCFAEIMKMSCYSLGSLTLFLTLTLPLKLELYVVLLHCECMSYPQ